MEYTYIYSDKCWFKNKCVRQTKKGCDISCPIRSEFDYLLCTSNIPDGYKEIKKLMPEQEDYNAFVTLKQIQKDIEAFVDNGRILYLWGHNCGTGKTEFACKLLKTYLAVKCYGNRYKDIAWFEYAPSFILCAKEFNTPERQIRIQNLSERKFCIIDDIGATYNSQYDISVLSSIIDSRYSKKLATIYTSNLAPKDIKNNVGERLADRILSDIVIELKGKSRRKSTETYISNPS